MAKLHRRWVLRYILPRGRHCWSGGCLAAGNRREEKERRRVPVASPGGAVGVGYRRTAQVRQRVVCVVRERPSPTCDKNVAGPRPWALGFACDGRFGTGVSEAWLIDSL